MKAASLFRERFGGEPDGVWLAPGRANLMGEHTDYNDGFVLPFALGQGVTAAAARPSRRLTLCSRQEPKSVVEVGLDRLAPGQVTGWAAYPAGVAWALEAAGHRVPGACIAIDSDLQRRRAVLIGRAGVRDRAGADLARRPGRPPRGSGDDHPAGGERVRRGADRHHGPVRVAAVPGRARAAARLPLARGLAGAVRPGCGRAGLLLINTRARHELTDGEYGRRRAECEEAARRLGIPSLRDLTNPGDTDSLTDPVLRRRARHVVTDNQRVLEVVALLQAPPGPPADTYREIGRLLTQAHVSLRDDFEVSWPEADAAVEAALAAGAAGARMIGGGFGGSVLALVPPADQGCGPVREAVTAAFARRGWTAPEFLDAIPADSARQVDG